MFKHAVRWLLMDCLRTKVALTDIEKRRWATLAGRQKNGVWCKTLIINGVVMFCP